MGSADCCHKQKGGVGINTGMSKQRYHSQVPPGRQRLLPLNRLDSSSLRARFPSSLGRSLRRPVGINVVFPGPRGEREREPGEVTGTQPTEARQGSMQMTQRSGCRSLGLQPLMHGGLSGGWGEGGRADRGPPVCLRGSLGIWRLGLHSFDECGLGEQARAGWRGRR